MALVKCRTKGCNHKVREGLKRPSYKRGSDGQELADGEFCWRCRRRSARLVKKSRAPEDD